MKHIKYSVLLLAVLLLLFTPGIALAQDYSFSEPKETVNVYWNEDGSASVDYVFVFNNNPAAPSIQFVDVGIKNKYFDVNSISADVGGKPVYNFSTSDFQGEGGSGVAVGLGSYSIPPGKSGTVHVFIGTVNRVLYPDDKDSNYASAVYTPSWFGSKYVNGATDLTVTFHLPPGVKPDEPRWHASPSGFPSEPVADLDDKGRVTYTWNNPNASGSTSYEFGASFPKQYVPASAIVQKSLLDTLGISLDTLITLTLCGGGIAFVILMIIVAGRSAQRRRLAYLPPKISIEGHGIKRGLTAIEAAILLEEPMDKVLTMILFAVVKKNAATVTSRDPLTIQVSDPQPEGLQPYETKFLEAFQQKDKTAQRKGMQDLMVELVQEVTQKMKGFSRRETVAYYRDIMTRAWAEVEAANTPEVKSAKYDEVMEWTMLDRNYDDRTRRVFTGGPVFVPLWWPRFDPGFGHGGTGASVTPSSSGSGGGGGISMPTLPGSAFAASVIAGPQHLAQSVIGNVTDFTSGITNKTNPPPPPPPASSSRGGWSSGGGHACACACACAGCACACAGGGR